MGTRQGPVLSWDQRVKIALSAALGIEFLHHKTEPCIIHGDVTWLLGLRGESRGGYSTRDATVGVYIYEAHEARPMRPMYATLYSSPSRVSPMNRQPFTSNTFSADGKEDLA
jgi:hypothetical protein